MDKKYERHFLLYLIRLGPEARRFFGRIGGPREDPKGLWGVLGGHWWVHKGPRWDQDGEKIDTKLPTNKRQA